MGPEVLASRHTNICAALIRELIHSCDGFPEWHDHLVEGRDCLVDTRVDK